MIRGNRASNLKSHLKIHHGFELEEDKKKKRFSKSKKQDKYLLNMLIMEWIAVGQHPLSIVQEPLFKLIFTSLGVELFSANTLKEKYLPQLMALYSNPILEKIVTIDSFSITSDGWTTSNSKKIHWSAMTVHWINDQFQLNSMLLDIGDLGISATAEVICRTWEYQIKKWNLEDKNLCGTTLDGAAHYQKAGSVELWTWPPI